MINCIFNIRKNAGKTELQNGSKIKIKKSENQQITSEKLSDIRPYNNSLGQEFGR